MPVIPMQLKLDSKIPDDIIGNIDFSLERELLINMDRFLMEGGLQKEALENSILKDERKIASKALSPKAQLKRQSRAILALRCGILRKQLNLSYRNFSKTLALAPLYQWFCGINRFAGVRVPSKSALQKMEYLLSADLIKNLEKRFLEYVKCESGKGGRLELEKKIDISNCFFDTFCLDTNIHFPVDWILLRDASRTLMLGVIQIRKHGLVNRMANDCQDFISKMNGLCMKITFASRTKDAKKKRKKCFREMKGLVKIIQRHAKKHLALLLANWEQTDLSYKQMLQIAKRIENILSQLPKAIKIGHERIIGMRKVLKKDKILSLYEPFVDIIVRKKSGKEVEFGNKISLMEQADGFIVDWEMSRTSAPSDHKLFQESYDRTRKNFGEIKSLATDRGCFSKKNSEHLTENKTFDGTCPKNVADLKKRMQESEFKRLQKRRASTEARISILQDFTGEHLKCKGFEHRRQQFGISVLTHNLWKLARLLIAARKNKAKILFSA